jgi:putative SOS response-associated peptidase YedK
MSLSHALGLVPSWWKKPLTELPATFNARAETSPKSRRFGQPSMRPEQLRSGMLVAWIREAADLG